MDNGNSSKKRFMTWSKPQFNGVLVGLVSGLLVLGVIAGISAVYNILNQDSYVQFGDGQWYYLMFPFLFSVFSLALLSFVGIALPLMRTLRRGKKVMVTAFAAEMLVFLVGIIVLVLFASHLHQSGDGTYQACDDMSSTCCNMGACINPGGPLMQ